MITGLKVSPLPCKCAFYKPEHNAKGGRHEIEYEDQEMQKWNIQKNGVQRADEEKRVIC